MSRVFGYLQWHRRSPPGTYSPKAGKLVGVRYPRWLQCPHCHIIGLSRRWSEDPGDPALYCASCTDKVGGRNRVHVVPVRFILLCERGHLEEFPGTGGLNTPRNCPSRHDLGAIRGARLQGSQALFSNATAVERNDPWRDALAQMPFLGNATDDGPWLGADADEPCSAKPRVVQRGASNIYFPVVESTPRYSTVVG